MRINYAPTVRARSKRAPRRCLEAKCPQLTKHRSQRCPDHRTH
ncbi:hypothetical protein [Rhodococcus artemisiae]|uniref:Uncharacterized protein n=1 Tax=Rhodococcus artemisiae TaxID=714159 RepID=A0ABU7L9Q7_9NOCA|nr:hypothetical protein [Rhodococcus artemisiae]MEE2058270.1 hypothetical protein [Rhodococcus artemisiae]